MSTFIITITAIMALVLVLFNVAMRLYFEDNAKRELENIFSTMNILIENQLISAVVEGGGDEGASLGAALTASRMSGNEFYIFDDDFTLLFPQGVSGTMLNETLTQRIKQYDFDGSGSIEKVGTPEGTFFIAGMPFDALASGRLHIVFAAGMADKNDAVAVMNEMLIGIMLLSLAIGIAYTAASARSLTRPIREVCAYAREIGNGNFITVPPDQSSQETRALTESMSEMSSRLKTADQAQKSFLQNASHELRTPLMSIRGYAEAIERGIGGDPVKAASVIRSESIRLTTLVEELITLSKIDNNIYDTEFARLDLGGAVTDCVGRLNGFALRENKKITPELLPGVTVSADDDLLAQALMNVVSNCIRYARTEVVIRLTSENGSAVIMVSDDGSGFAEEDLPHLFQRFYKGKGGQFGLGLVIAQKALERLDGVIQARNTGVGAEYVIRLPLALLHDE
jgi:signal transduction histidine kinase